MSLLVRPAAQIKSSPRLHTRLLDLHSVAYTFRRWRAQSVSRIGAMLSGSAARDFQGKLHHLFVRHSAAFCPQRFKRLSIELLPEIV